MATLPAPVREPVCRFLTVLDTVPLGRLQRDYVETFDVTRRCCLYLTYFAHGTRKRGLALVQFKQAYRKAGVEFDAAELPDHLCVVLEFGAPMTLTPPAGRSTTTAPESRCSGSPWRRRAPGGDDLLLALASTLPELKGEDEEKMIALIAQGPPSEEVGLDLQPYAMDPGSTPPQRVDRARRHHPGRSALMDTFLFLIFPYLCLAVFVVGHTGATSTTSSAGPRAPPSCTRTGSCAGAPPLPLRTARCHRGPRHRPRRAEVMDRGPRNQ